MKQLRELIVSEAPHRGTEPRRPFIAPGYSPTACNCRKCGWRVVFAKDGVCLRCEVQKKTNN